MRFFKFLKCMFLGHSEWRPSQLRDYPFIYPIDPNSGDQWEVRICDRCHLVYLEKFDKHKRIPNG